MGKRSRKYSVPSQDIKVAATTKIWGFTVAILAICIPLSKVTRSRAIIPLAALGGATVSTLAIWRSDDKKAKSPYLPGQQIELLEQRIANLETIVSSDDSYLHKKIQRLESDVTADVPNQVTTSENKA